MAHSTKIAASVVTAAFTFFAAGGSYIRNKTQGADQVHPVDSQSQGSVASTTKLYESKTDLPFNPWFPRSPIR